MSAPPRAVGGVGGAPAGGKAQKPAPIGGIKPSLTPGAEAAANGRAPPVTGLNQPMVPFIPPPEWQRRESGWAVDDLLPTGDVCDGCRIAIAAEPDRILPALVTLELRRSWAERLLFALRVSPEFAGRADHRPTGHTLADLRALGLTLLIERPGAELAYGLAGRPWLTDPDLRRLTPEGFVRFADRRCARLAWSFRLDIDGAEAGVHWLASELRVQCLSDEVRWVLGGYWTMIRPFAGQVMRQMLAAVKQRAEAGEADTGSEAALIGPVR